MCRMANLCKNLFSSISFIAIMAVIMICLPGKLFASEFEVIEDLRVDTNSLFVDGSADNVGIGTSTPNQKLSVAGSLGILEGGVSPTDYTIFQGGTQTGNITYTLPDAVPTITGQVLSSTTGGVMSWMNAGTGTVGGTGTDNYIPRWNGTTNLENSVMFDNGTNIGIGTTNPAVKLAVSAGDISIDDNQQIKLGDGTGGNTYFSYNSTDNATEMYVDGTLVARLKK